MTYFLLGAANF